MTPKGVEHETKGVHPRVFYEVKIPMTPKGVEHMPRYSAAAPTLDVKIPMTPKGVEHMSAAYCFLTRSK